MAHNSPVRVKMGVAWLLKELRAELAILNGVILELQCLHAGRFKKRDRSPKWLTEARFTLKKPRKKAR
jgi:hypothetical protein